MIRWWRQTILLSALISGAVTFILNVLFLPQNRRVSRPLKDLSKTWWKSHEAFERGERNERTLKEQYEFTVQVLFEAMEDDLTAREAMELKEILYFEVAELARIAGMDAVEYPVSMEAQEG